MRPDELTADVMWPRYTVGTYREDRTEAECVLLHDSPPDQEAVGVVLTETFICCPTGKVIEIQRHQFHPICTQEFL